MVDPVQTSDLKRRYLSFIIDGSLAVATGVAVAWQRAEDFAIAARSEGRPIWDAETLNRLRELDQFEVLGVKVARAQEVGDTLKIFGQDAIVPGVLAGLLAAFVLFALVPALLGRTLGMLPTGLRIGTVDGKPVGIMAHVVRTVVGLFDAIPLVLPGAVGFLLARSSKKHQRLGDRVAGTVVYSDKAPRRNPHLPTELQTTRIQPTPEMSETDALKVAQQPQGPVLGPKAPQAVPPNGTSQTATPETVVPQPEDAGPRGLKRLLRRDPPAPEEMVDVSARLGVEPPETQPQDTEEAASVATAADAAVVPTPPGVEQQKTTGVGGSADATASATDPTMTTEIAGPAPWMDGLPTAKAPDSEGDGPVNPAEGSPFTPGPPPASVQPSPTDPGQDVFTDVAPPVTGSQVSQSQVSEAQVAAELGFDATLPPPPSHRAGPAKPTSVPATPSTPAPDPGLSSPIEAEARTPRPADEISEWEMPVAEPAPVWSVDQPSTGQSEPATTSVAGSTDEAVAAGTPTWSDKWQAWLYWDPKGQRWLRHDKTIDTWIPIS